MLSSFPKLAIWLVIILTAGSTAASGQSSSGRLTGKTLDKDGKPVPGVVVNVTNQTNSDVSVIRSKTDGSYSVRLRTGAYKINVRAAVREARFDRGKAADYGVFSNFICDDTKKKCATLENVIIDGSERKIDFVVVDPPQRKPNLRKPAEAVKPAGPDRREVRDRWRYEFPGIRPLRRQREHADATSHSSEAAWYNPYTTVMC